MNKSHKPEKETVNVKLQKTISNLISNVISSLCQQVVQYEHSIDIFGLLCINIDDDVDISVKLNEKFIKKEVNGSGVNINYSKLIETIQKNDSLKSLESVNNEMELDQNRRNEEIDVENKENDCPLLIDESEKSSKQKRRPRKPQHTFRHVVEEDIPNSKDVDKSKCDSGDTDNELKIDTQFECESNCKLRKTNASVVQSESISKSNDTDESDEKLQQTTESIEKISPTRSILNHDNADKKFDSSFSSAKLSQMYKCTICDRQFKRKFCLTRHKRVHQNYKTYLCNICGLGFDLINQLKRHLRNAHACSRENLRRSCRNNPKTEGVIKSSTDQYCPLDCSWPLTKVTSQLPLLPAKQITISSTAPENSTAKTLCFNQFSFPPGLIIANSGKKPSPSAFSQTFTTPTSVSTQYQVRQMFNSIMSATDASLPYNNALYYMQNYAHILPTTSNALYHHSLSNGNTPKSMPNLSSAPSTTNTMTITNSNSQRLPIYRFPPGLFTSPTLKSIPLPINSNWSNIIRAPDSNQVDKVKQSGSPMGTPSNQLTRVSD